MSGQYLRLSLVLASGLLSGCSLLHELQPHRLHKLNNFPAPSLDPEFSAQEPSTETQVAEQTETRVVIRAQR